MSDLGPLFVLGQIWTNRATTFFLSWESNPWTGMYDTITHKLVTTFTPSSMCEAMLSRGYNIFQWGYASPSSFLCFHVYSNLWKYDFPAVSTWFFLDTSRGQKLESWKAHNSKICFLDLEKFVRLAVSPSWGKDMYLQVSCLEDIYSSQRPSLLGIRIPHKPTPTKAHFIVL